MLKKEDSIMKLSYLALVLMLINMSLVVYGKTIMSKTAEQTDDSDSNSQLVKIKTTKPPVVKLGMTWKWVSRNSNLNIDFVGCNGCNAYIGDTPCDQALPILCVSKSNFKRPPYDVPSTSPGVMAKEFYYGWSGGNYLTTEPIVGSTIGSKANANKICSDRFGSEFIGMEHHLGRFVNGMNSGAYYYQSWPSSTSSGGWNAYGYGNVSKTDKFWAFIDDQPSNCWN